MDDLFGREERDKTIERLFVGLMLAPEAATAASAVLEDLRRSEGLKGSAVREERLHITLVHVGDYLGAIPRSVIAEALDALGQVRADAFEAVFDQAGSFAGAPMRNPCVLLSSAPEAISAMREDVWKGLLRAGLRTLSKTAFTPHVTLAYADRRIATRAVAPIRWRVDEIRLIHSEVNRSTYHALGRFPLVG